MKKALFTSSTIAFLMLAATSSYAQGRGNDGKPLPNPACSKPNPPLECDSIPVPVPEIDAASSSLALALLCGFVVLRRERCNRG